MGSGASKKAKGVSKNKDLAEKEELKKSVKELKVQEDESKTIVLEKSPAKTGISAEDYKLVKKAIQKLELTSDAFAIKKEDVGEVTYTRDDTVTKQSQHCDYCYVIAAGQCRVVSEDETDFFIELAILEKGDVFGVNATFFDLPNSDTVTALAGTRLLFIHKDKLNVQARPADHEAWVIRTKQFICASSQRLSSSQRTKVFKRMVVECLHNTGIFKKWPKIALAKMVNGLGQGRIWLMPTGAVLVQHGVEARPEHLYILCKGQMKATSRVGGLSAVIKAQKYPFVIGEENYFSEQPYCVTIKALTPCYVVAIEIDNIDMILLGSQHKSTLCYWEYARYRWTMTRIPDLRHLVKIPYEILLVKLRESPSFRYCTPIFVYNCMWACFCASFGDGDVIAEDFDEEDEYSRININHHVIVVLKGAVKWMRGNKKEKTLTANSVAFGLDRSITYYKECTLVSASKECIILAMPLSSIERTLVSDPGNCLYVE